MDLTAMLKPACSAFQRKRTSAGLALTAKLLLIMKLTAILLLAAGLTASAHGHSQKVSLRVKDAPIEEVFRSLKKQTGYNFVYANDVLTQAKPVNLSINNSTLDEVLLLLFKSQPLSYAVVDKVVVVKVRLVSPKENVDEEASVLPPIEITGKVTTKEGEPLAGASVVIKRTGRGTQTDANGNFKLTGVEAGDVLTISYTGYTQRTVKVGDIKTIFISLEVATNELDQVVVQAYGTTTNRFNTGNIAKVTAAEIEKQPVMNVLQALQGRVPGLVVTQTNGYASAPFKVEIRGRNPINTRVSGEPLFIIDGVPITMRDNYGFYGISGFSQSSFVGPAGGQSPLFSINPNDIESIEVLKDADATAIYGSRGANGVILITTKKGKAAKTTLNINISQGISKVSRYWDMMNTQEYVAMRREAFVNDGITPDPFNAYDIVTWDTTRYTDWQRLLFGGTGKIINTQASLSGGNEQTNFRVSAAYNQMTSILAISGSDQRTSLNLHLNHKAFNRRLNLNFTASSSYSQSDIIENGSSGVGLPPNAPSIFDSEGKLNWRGWDPESYRLPFASLLQPYLSKTNYLNSNLTTTYQIIGGLNLSVNFGFSRADLDQVRIYPKASQDPISQPSSSSQFGENKVNNWIIEPQLEYNTILGKGNLNALVGGTIQSNKTSGFTFRASGYSNDELLYSKSAASIYSDLEYNYAEYKYAAAFARINYNLLNKYIVNLSARRDGSSRFGPGKQFGIFWAIGTAWIFSEENFFKRNLAFLSFGKIRGSYGITGSDQVNDYGFLSSWQPINNLGDSYYQGLSGLLPSRHFNPDYSWQSNKKLELAIDLGFLKDRIFLSTAWYMNRCGNQLLEMPLPVMTGGFRSVTNNLPALVQNNGWEFVLRAKLLEEKNIRWSLNFNTGINKNKLISFPNLDQSTYRSVYEVGKPLNIRKSLKFLGVDPATGLYLYEDKDKDGLIETSTGPDGDMFIYELNPIVAGVGTVFSYKKLEISAQFQLVKQKGVSAGVSLNGFPGELFGNQPRAALYRWQQPGDNAAFARFTTAPYLDPTSSYYNIYSSDAVIGADASFIRLQNLTLSYSIPSKLFGKKGESVCVIYFQGQNLFTITKYDGVDPETQNFGSMPTLRTYVMGVSFNF